jgi:hypothetical protein
MAVWNVMLCSIVDANKCFGGMMLDTNVITPEKIIIFIFCLILLRCSNLAIVPRSFHEDFTGKSYKRKTMKWCVIE